jgi:ankyrin repeat protein
MEGLMHWRLVLPVAFLAIPAAPSLAGDLYNAVATGDLAQVSSAAESADVNDDRGDLGTPLHLAALKGDAAMVALLIKKGAAVNATNDDGAGPLSLAAAYGSPEVVELLVGAGADVNARNLRRTTPLIEAVQGRNTEAIRVLLLTGRANLNLTDLRGDAALHIALNNREEAIARILLEHGADAKVAGRYRMTPLHWAAELGLVELIPALVAKGADLSAKNAAAETPLASAIAYREPAAEAALRSLGAKE